MPIIGAIIRFLFKGCRPRSRRRQRFLCAWRVNRRHHIYTCTLIVTICATASTFVWHVLSDDVSKGVRDPPPPRGSGSTRIWRWSRWYIVPCLYKTIPFCGGAPSMNHWAGPRVAANALSFDMIYHVSSANVLINLRVKQPVTNFTSCVFFARMALHLWITQYKWIRRKP